MAVATGLGEARNLLVVRTADVVVAVGGEFGTLSEIAFALRLGTPVVGIGTWELSQAGPPRRRHRPGRHRGRGRRAAAPLDPAQAILRSTTSE